METFPTVLRRSGLVDLSDDGAVDGTLVGAKAANLARARACRPARSCPGVVLTTDWDHRGWSHPSRSEQSPARGPRGRRSAPRGSGRSSSGRRPPTRTAARRRWPACSSRCSTCGLAELRRRRRPRARLAAPGRRGRRPHGRAGPAAARAALRRRALRRRPGVGPHRPAPRWPPSRAGRIAWSAGSTTAGRRCCRPRGRVLEDRGGAALPLGRPRCGRSPGWRPGPATPSAPRRTSSGRSTTTAPCGCCRAAPSPRRPGDPAARSSAPVRWPRRSPSR